MKRIRRLELHLDFQTRLCKPKIPVCRSSRATQCGLKYRIPSNVPSDASLRCSDTLTRRSCGKVNLVHRETRGTHVVCLSQSPASCLYCSNAFQLFSVSSRAAVLFVSLPCRVLRISSANKRSSCRNSARASTACYAVTRAKRTVVFK